MVELLLELLSEEIPARMQARGAGDLKRLVCDGLKKSGLSFTGARAFATPRRLTLVVDGIPEKTEDQADERRGPRVGAPDQAIQGFLKATGLTSIDQAEKRDTGKGEFWFATQRVAGAPALSSVVGVVEDALQSMPWPKSMRWANHKTSWVRPLHSIVAQLDGKEIPVRFYYERTEDAVSNPAKYLQAGDITLGHRFLSKGSLTVSGFADYQAKLRAEHVMLDPAERRRVILDGAQKLCTAAQVALKNDEGLLDEVAGLVEWPVPLMGTIDAEFMDVPPEVLIVSMKTHQRYFATTKKDGTLANRFVVVANNVARDGGKTIALGNERVLRARLSDAKFFWDQDRKLRLEDRLPALKSIVFHAKLGTQAERVERILAIARDLMSFVPNVDQVQLSQAARLCKADLVTGMVGEFPELQGTMGRYYARYEGLPEAVADAIGDHYSPAGPTDRCPTAPLSIVIALADKLDSLVSFWAIGEKPTGSRDPFALRRAALGVIRLIVDNGIRIELTNVLAKALVFSLIHANVAEQGRIKRSSEHDVYKEPFAASAALMQLAAEVTQLGEIARGQRDLPQKYIQSITDLMTFFGERLKVQMREKGVQHDVIDALLALADEDDIVRLLARAEALQTFLGTEAGKNFLIAYGRAANIVRAEEKKDKGLTAKIISAPDPALFAQDEETALLAQLVGLSMLDRIDQEDFVGAMDDLATLRAPLDAFFDKVTVNAQDKPELRLNRLKLLNQIRATMDSVADFSKIEG